MSRLAREPDAVAAREEGSARRGARRGSHRRTLGEWFVRGAGLGLGVLLVVVVTMVVQSAMNVVVLVFLSILLAAAIDPLVMAVRSRINVSRVKVVLGVYVGLVALSIVLALLLVPAAVNQLTELSARLPALTDESRAWRRHCSPRSSGPHCRGSSTRSRQASCEAAWRLPMPRPSSRTGPSAADAVISVITIFTLVFFWLISRETMQRFGLSMLPLARRQPVRLAWTHGSAHGARVRGQLTPCSRSA